MNIIGAAKTAFSSIWRNKLTSLLAILGVVIGVASVSTLISVGEGLKNDMSDVIQGMGTNVIAITSGKMDLSDPSSMNQTNPANFISGDILTIEDIDAVRAMPEIEAISPIMLVVGDLTKDGKKAYPTIAGVYPEVMDAVQILDMEQGDTFKENNNDKVIVLGSNAKEALFENKNPIGEKITLGKNGEFTVIGTIASASSSASFASEFDTIAYIPFNTAKELNNGEVNILRVLAKAKENADIAQVKQNITDTLIKNHNGEEDFTVMTQDDMLDLFGSFLGMATAMVSAIAAISVIVGGIGIMNIMLVSVTERTREIGIRKAVGATNGAILAQFLIESIVITMLGGAVGLSVTFVAGAVISAQTPLSPAITVDILAFAIVLSIVVGVIFGLLPAIRASRKNPIEALRYE